jgi:uncharacterized membrane protein YcaP (DUF421 family)
VTLPYLASLANGQLSVLNRHVLEHEAQHNIADKAMLKDDLENVRRTLDKFEQELEKEGEKDESRRV